MSDGRRGRSLTDDEDALWRGVARSVKPLRARTAKRSAESVSLSPAPTKAKSKIRSVETSVVPPPVRAIPKQPPAVPTPVAIDRRTKKKLARGREDIDARLDLHGMTQAEAHAALSRFLHRVQADGAKFVIVVTGKGGRGDGERGVLRRQVPLWLRLPEFRSIVVGFETAHIGHGGEGALYVRVRRGR
jgi:DNA-nicking Smr family endonuclease